MTGYYRGPLLKGRFTRVLLGSDGGPKIMTVFRLSSFGQSPPLTMKTKPFFLKMKQLEGPIAGVTLIPLISRRKQPNSSHE
mmetsp:Transcript_7530/g.10589  ORF Transcript_7530/g.10589 Transcript_7530/m.10589 type:complete len:81 (+) Transcript_7530:543-785(+)